MPNDSSKPLLTMKKDSSRPSLGHRVGPVTFDISLTVPNGGKHTLDGIRAGQGLS